MKLRYSMITRKRFLNRLFGGWFLALLTTLIYPVLRFITPPYREPDKVLLPLLDCQAIPDFEALRFAWGNKPAMLIRHGQELRAFVGVCAHLDCNVTWQSEKRRFFCACHDGWYDEDGVNIAGPPPRPLRQLKVEITSDMVVVTKQEANT